VEIVEKLNQPEMDLEEVGRIIAQDVGMTAQVLKLVNSAFFGLRRQLANASEAVTYLGGETMKSLVLSIHAFSQFESADLGEFSLDKLRSHSTEVAAAAKAIALAEGAEVKVVDEAFVAGMLHDIGKLVLLSNFGKQYREVFRLEQEKQVDASAAEERVFGANHADIGGYLLGLWGLPVPVVEAIALHHSPRSSPQKTFTPLTAVHVADALVHGAEANGAAVPPDRLDAQYLAELGLTGRIDAWRKAWQNNS
jgi:HD-like signal output (HDOD) protein